MEELKKKLEEKVKIGMLVLDIDPESFDNISTHYETEGIYKYLRIDDVLNLLAQHLLKQEKLTDQELEQSIIATLAENGCGEKQAMSILEEMLQHVKNYTASKQEKKKETPNVELSELSVSELKSLRKEINAIIQELEPEAPKPDWIDVKERLPEEGQLVLAVIADFVCGIRKYSEGEWYNEYNQSTRTFMNQKEDITKWQPLPKI